VSFDYVPPPVEEHGLRVGALQGAAACQSRLAKVPHRVSSELHHPRLCGCQKPSLEIDDPGVSSARTWPHHEGHTGEVQPSNVRNDFDQLQEVIGALYHVCGYA